MNKEENVAFFRRSTLLFAIENVHKFVVSPWDSLENNNTKFYIGVPSVFIGWDRSKEF